MTISTKLLSKYHDNLWAGHFRVNKSQELVAQNIIGQVFTAALRINTHMNLSLKKLIYRFGN